jgi:aryl-alcohol dehydrogenase-like predicted oxidoreductase
VRSLIQEEVASLQAKDIRRAMPRFAPDAFATNLGLLPSLQAVADEAGCSLAQLALAWLLSRSDHIIPIPGTTQPAHLADNLGAMTLRLNAAQMATLDALMAPAGITGERYNAASQAEVDTEAY